MPNTPERSPRAPECVRLHGSIHTLGSGTAFNRASASPPLTINAFAEKAGIGHMCCRGQQCTPYIYGCTC